MPKYRYRQVSFLWCRYRENIADFRANKSDSLQRRLKEHLAFELLRNPVQRISIDLHGVVSKMTNVARATQLVGILPTKITAAIFSRNAISKYSFDLFTSFSWDIVNLIGVLTSNGSISWKCWIYYYIWKESASP